MWQAPQRTDAGQRSLLAELQTRNYTSKKGRADALREAGFGSLHSALQYIPGAKLDTDAKKDIMHLFLRGLTGHESFWVRLQSRLHFDHTSISILTDHSLITH